MEPLAPRIVKRPAFRVVGMTGWFTPATTSEIHRLWGMFGPRMASVPGRKGVACYGLCMPNATGPSGELGFEYTACVEVGVADRAPEGMVAVSVPANTYAVFTHRGHISKIGETFDAIHTRGLSASGHTRASGPEFETYDERWDPATGMGDVDIFVPVRAP